MKQRRSHEGFLFAASFQDTDISTPVRTHTQPRLQLLLRFSALFCCDFFHLLLFSPSSSVSPSQSVSFGPNLSVKYSSALRPRGMPLRVTSHPLRGGGVGLDEGARGQLQSCARAWRETRRHAYTDSSEIMYTHFNSCSLLSLGPALYLQLSFTRVSLWLLGSVWCFTLVCVRVCEHTSGVQPRTKALLLVRGGLRGGRQPDWLRLLCLTFPILPVTEDVITVPLWLSPSSCCWQAEDHVRTQDGQGRNCLLTTAKLQRWTEESETHLGVVKPGIVLSQI